MFVIFNDDVFPFAIARNVCSAVAVLRHDDVAHRLREGESLVRWQSHTKSLPLVEWDIESIKVPE